MTKSISLVNLLADFGRPFFCRSHSLYIFLLFFSEQSLWCHYWKSEHVKSGSLL